MTAGTGKRGLICTVRDFIGRAMWTLHLYGLKGWWDAGTDAGESRRYRRRYFRETGIRP